MASQSDHHRRRESHSKRSRSPYTRDREDVNRNRSRSPHRKRHHHHKHHDRTVKTNLPYKRAQLKKDDFTEYKALFAEYLDVQKSIDIDSISEHEAKGRWKSFLGKWNHGELSQGWYDPEMKERVDERWKTRPKASRPKQRVPAETNAGEEDEDEDDDGYGPALPGKTSSRPGPAIPSLDDLQHRQELADEDRSARIADLRYERKADRNLQKERAEELAPRADPGSRERQMEKKQVVTAVNQEFKDAKDGGDVEVGDNELMGDDGVDGYKKQVNEMEKKKNERELRKEEVLRARAAEREERLQAQRAKEEKTMSMLRGLARERFG
ncbi:hypothetical protein M409DRAFT_22561 [Zasmidium cellare ATCC 36951]|uniref:RNA helicase HEL117 n=1 Tax=Zasmidium cellare ATCC 36951 TaxID=1080233 RepID=A0A6A6CMZ7_ZASCE|nr:uncharacterized protein M409DRAFT_22561 [Zasmidium cellare ATCC 36951]KAF2167129.1 hypothetical protein M409DRAFT_22561 [Zasmidium cellare ATCC 36951]